MEPEPTANDITTLARLFDYPQLCLHIGLLDYRSFAKCLMLSKTIHDRLFPLLEIIQRTHPHFGLWFLIPKFINPGLEPLHNNLVGKNILLPIPINEKYTHLNEPADVEIFLNEETRFRRLFAPNPVEFLKRIGNRVEFMVQKLDARWTYWYEKLANQQYLISVSKDEKHWFPVARSFASLFSEICKLNSIASAWKIPYEDEYFRRLSKVWPRNYEFFVYDFCSNCKGGKEPIDTRDTSAAFCSCQKCFDYRLCHDCHQIHVQTPLHEHQIRQADWLCCGQCGTFIHSSRKGSYFECELSLNAWRGHRNHRVCYDCLQRGLFHIDGCVCIWTESTRAKYCDICGKDIYAHQWANSLTCPECEDFGSYDICSTCVSKARSAEWHLKHYPMFTKPKSVPKNAKQLSKRQRKKFMKSIHQTIAFNQEQKNRVLFLKNFNHHEHKNLQSLWHNVLCQGCEIECKQHHYLCTLCQVAICPSCRPNILEHDEHNSLIEFKDQMPASIDAKTHIEESIKLTKMYID